MKKINKKCFLPVPSLTRKSSGTFYVTHIIWLIDVRSQPSWPFYPKRICCLRLLNYVVMGRRTDILETSDPSFHSLTFQAQISPKKIQS